MRAHHSVVSKLPGGVSADDVATEILAKLPEYQEIPEYKSSGIIIIM